MGRKLDALLGRSSVRTSKFKPLLALALSRVAVLKTQRQARCTQSRSDVLQLLQLGHHERALLRVEQVIKEHNMLDVFVMIERYCNLLIERVHLIEQERECPDELKEAASSMIYAASRCGDFPELQEIRGLLTARYGKEFTANAVELRNHCGVNLIMIQKLSTRMPTMESRMKVLKEIASENSIVLNLEEASGPVEDKNQAPAHPLASSSGTAGSAEILQSFKEETEKDDKYSKMKYKDVAHAAQAAFESAAYAAAAARAAVELSRSDSHDSDDQNSPGLKRGKLSSRFQSSKTEFGSQSEHITIRDQTEEMKKSASSSSSDSEGGTVEANPVSSDAIGQASHSGKDIAFDDSDSEQSTRAPSPNKNIPSRVQSGMKVEPERSSRRLTLNLEKGPFSLRNKLRGF